MKQAVIVVHGMGEQIPMQTLQAFVDTVWTTDDDLIRRGRPDSTTGKSPRTQNAVWSKPDPRNRSYELRRLTTESTDTREATDFYEFYWAHLMHGTTWEQVKTWLFDLLWRRPGRVPRQLFGAWLALWVLSLLIGAGVVAAAILPGPVSQWLGGQCAVGALCWQAWLPSLLATAFSLGLGALVGGFLVVYVGDVARYLKADPPNVSRRQEIREKGVELLETLMGIGPDGTQLPTPYDRVIVVAHSLGTVVAYDILTHCFARINTRLRMEPEPGPQPQRAELEAMIRAAAGLDSVAAPIALDIEAFQEQQAACRTELNAQGNPWIVSDFITLGSPLAHAEALMALDMMDLRKSQERRIFPTCPPTLEHDLKTQRKHFSFRAGAVGKMGDDKDVEAPRLPHHAALFAYTRWTNLYSPSKFVAWGDVVSGPVGPQFGLQIGERQISGIRDIPVLENPAGLPPFLAHVKYWDQKPPIAGETFVAPAHVAALRRALDLKSG